MKNPEMKVIRFSGNDIIVTSTAPVLAVFNPSIDYYYVPVGAAQKTFDEASATHTVGSNPTDVTGWGNCYNLWYYDGNLTTSRENNLSDGGYSAWLAAAGATDAAGLEGKYFYNVGGTWYYCTGFTNQ